MHEDRATEGNEGVTVPETFPILVLTIFSCCAFRVVLNVIESYSYKIAKGRTVADIECTRFEMCQLKTQDTVWLLVRIYVCIFTQHVLTSAETYILKF